MRSYFFIIIFVLLLVVMGSANSWQSIVLSPKQEKHTDTLHDLARPIFKKFIQQVFNDLGYSCLITSSFRTFKQQEELSETNKSSVGYSYHNYGFAIDCNFSKAGKSLTSKSGKTAWVNSGIPAIAKKLGLRWGGNFASVDLVHFDYAKYTTQQLYSIATNQMGYTKASEQGNKVKLS